MSASVSATAPSAKQAGDTSVAASPPALLELEARVARDIALVTYPARDWVPPLTGPDGARVLDVAIIGAGQCGLTAAFALRMEKVDNVRIFERARAGAEGPWVTYARMNTLRTPKHITGPDLGIPSLTTQAWYEARYGEAAWRATPRIPRGQWMEYLNWYRRVLRLPVENGVELLSFEPTVHSGRNLLRLALRDAAGERTCYARRLILATGIDGSGAWEPPPVVAGLPASRWAHTNDDIDFAALAGRRIGVLGAGASAFDNAAVALEAGAREVHLFYRRATLPRVNHNRWMERTGVLAHWGDMPDEWRWRFLRTFHVENQPPPQDTFERCTMHKGFVLHPGADWSAAQDTPEGVRVSAGGAEHEFDFLITGTGLSSDLARRPELAPWGARCARWCDRYAPPVGEEHEGLAGHPYLGAAFELLPRVPGEMPWLSQVHLYNWGAWLSLGPSGSTISGMKFALRRLARGITESVYREDIPLHWQSLQDYEELELVSPELDRIEAKASGR